MFWTILRRIGHNCLIHNLREDKHTTKDSHKEHCYRLKLEIGEERIEALHAAIRMLFARAKREATALEASPTISFVEIIQGHHS